MGYFMDERIVKYMRKKEEGEKEKEEDAATLWLGFSWYIRGRGDGEYVEPTSSL